MNITFQENEYALFIYEDEDGRVDIADGIISKCYPDSIVIDYENTFGPSTPTRVLLKNILERFE
jgi:hypothetical protein